MRRKSPGEGEEESGQHHGQGRHGKEDMGYQDGKINSAQNAMAGIVAVAVDAVVGDIADQEYGREDEGGFLAKGVQLAIPRFDREPATDQEYRGGRVESRVHR